METNRRERVAQSFGPNQGLPQLGQTQPQTQWPNPSTNFAKPNKLVTSHNCRQRPSHFHNQTLSLQTSSPGD